MQIKTKKISHVFNKGTKQEFAAIKDVDSEIKQGQSIAIIGHTGSGKTTYIEHLNALIKPTKGSLDLEYKVGSNDKEIRKFNKKLNRAKKDADKIKLRDIISNLTKDTEVINVSKNIKKTKKKIKNVKEIRKRVGIVFQFAEYQLFEETIQKDIMFGPITMGMSKEAAKEQAKKYLKIVGMPDEFLLKSPFELSGGQKRRVALAGILAMEPDVLVLDEPTAGLDPQGSKAILDIFSKLNKDGKTIILVTHNLDDALERTEQTFMFSEGKLIKAANTYDILKDVDFLRTNQLEPPKILSFVRSLEKKGFKLPKVTSLDELAKEISKKIK